ncbi:MAG: hypothetical protein HC850_12750 [Rhodomicrobium sp.]|nr:hypothetical protein [Rhodomicrobium sp.]
MKRLQLIAPLALCIAAAAGQPAFAAASNDPDWPCIQRKVPHISPGMVWAGPPVDEADRSWEKSDELSDLVGRLAQRRLPVEESEPLIEAFAKQHAGDKARQLTLLFTGLLQTINRERDDIMTGISRYARQQRTRAEKIKELRDRLSALSGKSQLTESERAKRDTLEEQLSWETRIYDERAASLTYVCDSPRILEQRLFSLARYIQAQLD